MVKTKTPATAKFVDLAKMDLPFLASKAAIELEFLRQGKPSKCEAVNIISDAINNTNGNRNILLSRFLDPYESPMNAITISSAISEAKLGEPLTRDDITEIMGQIQIKLEKIIREPQDNLNEIEGIQDFFLTLARAIAAEERPYDDWTAQHPFKK